MANTILEIRRRLALPALLAAALGSTQACAGVPPPETRARPPAASAASAAPRVFPPCPAIVDVQALLSAHEREFGSPEEALSVLPKSAHHTAAYEGKDARYGDPRAPSVRFLDSRRFSWSREQYREEERLAGRYRARGRDANGAWTLTPDNVTVRLLDDEETPSMRAWILRRGYVDTMKHGRSTVVCEQEPRSDPVAHVTVADPAVGSAELRFNLTTARLFVVKFTDVSGRAIWLNPDWGSPRSSIPSYVDAARRSEVTNAWHETHEARSASRTIPREWSLDTWESRCMPLPLFGTGAGNEDCLAMPRGAEIAWPAALPIRAKLSLQDGAAIVDLGGHRVVLDHRVDAPTQLVAGPGPSRREGDLVQARDEEASPPRERLVVGPLEFRWLSARSPACIVIDKKCAPADIALGFALFANAAVRFDYVRKEVVIAPSSASLRSPQAIAHRVHVPRGAFDRDDPALPAAPSDVPGAQDLQGHASLSSCSAAIFDFRDRSVWLEPPCGRRTDVQRGQ